MGLMLFPLETSGSVPMWPVILLIIAAVVVLAFMIIQLRRILRRRPRIRPDHE